MSTQPVSMPPLRAVKVDSSAAGSSSLWERVSNWASEHKAVVYTIAGVAVVATSAGLVYYYRDSGADPTGAEHRPSKKERRKAKKDKEAAEKRAASG